jgi:hypothetical protein
MVALVQRLRKLEKKVADRSQIGHLDDRVVYQRSAEELAEAVAILLANTHYESRFYDSYLILYVTSITDRPYRLKIR